MEITILLAFRARVMVARGGSVKTRLKVELTERMCGQDENTPCTDDRRERCTVSMLGKLSAIYAVLL